PWSCRHSTLTDAVVDLLLNRIAFEADSKDRNGRTPLSYAEAGGLDAVVRLLSR
ncbi:hypothetical protein K469DRAFT_590620, partial [Zopfia rhizophila CBS 207.26]